MNRSKMTINKMEAAAIEIRAKMKLSHWQLDSERRLVGGGEQPFGMWRRIKYSQVAHWFPFSHSGPVDGGPDGGYFVAHCRTRQIYGPGFEPTASSLFCMYCASGYLGRPVPLGK